MIAITVEFANEIKDTLQTLTAPNVMTNDSRKDIIDMLDFLIEQVDDDFGDE